MPKQYKSILILEKDMNTNFSCYAFCSWNEVIYMIVPSLIILVYVRMWSLLNNKMMITVHSELVNKKFFHFLRNLYNYLLLNIKSYTLWHNIYFSKFLIQLAKFSILRKKKPTLVRTIYSSLLWTGAGKGKSRPISFISYDFRNPYKVTMRLPRTITPQPPQWIQPYLN